MIVVIWWKNISNYICVCKVLYFAYVCIVFIAKGKLIPLKNQKKNSSFKNKFFLETLPIKSLMTKKDIWFIHTINLTWNVNPYLLCLHICVKKNRISNLNFFFKNIVLNFLSFQTQSLRYLTLVFIEKWTNSLIDPWS